MSRAGGRSRPRTSSPRQPGVARLRGRQAIPTGGTAAVSRGCRGRRPRPGESNSRAPPTGASRLRHTVRAPGRLPWLASCSAWSSCPFRSSALAAASALIVTWPVPEVPQPDRSARMTSFLADLRSTVLPDRQGQHGPLPPLLLSMTMVTGLVDAFSYLVLGHVFVANMTGNVVFLAFALAGAPGFSIAASLTGLAAFAAGALLGGEIAARHGQHRGRLHSSAAAAQALFLAAAVVLAVIGAAGVTTGYRYGLIVSLGISMGIQNAAAR